MPGVVLNSVFLDMLDYDAATMQRINRFIRDLPEPKRAGLRPVDVLLVRPSRDLEEIAGEFEPDLPRSFRYAIRGLGTRGEKSSGLVATLLFTPNYIRRLIAIGEEDARARHGELAGFIAASASSA